MNNGNRSEACIGRNKVPNSIKEKYKANLIMRITSNTIRSPGNVWQSTTSTNLFPKKESDYGMNLLNTWQDTIPTPKNKKEEQTADRLELKSQGLSRRTRNYNFRAQQKIAIDQPWSIGSSLKMTSRQG